MLIMLVWVSMLVVLVVVVDIVVVVERLCVLPFANISG